MPRATRSWPESYRNSPNRVFPKSFILRAFDVLANDSTQEAGASRCESWQEVKRRMLRCISEGKSSYGGEKMKGTSRRGFLIAGSGLAALAAVPKSWGRELGEPVRPYGERSPFQKSQRFYHQSPVPETAASGTPLQDSYGIITPSSLHFESHHSGVPQIDPPKHELLIHGAVEHPLILKLEDLHRFPSVSRIHFIECAGNTAGDLASNPRPNVQRSHGLVSCSEWTGVSLATLLQEVGPKPQSKWILAEGRMPAAWHEVFRWIRLSMM
jgi:hypothetical protein